MTADKIIVAIDRPDAAGFWAVAEPLLERTSARWVKIGSVLFCAEGPQFVRSVVARGCNVFLDLKLHDIPHQVGLTVAALAQLGVRLLTVHTAGGGAMLEAAATAAGDDLRLLGVTVLTSHDPASLKATGVDLPLDETVVRRARLAAGSGLYGIVCSPLEVALARPALRKGMGVVTPGVRPRWATQDDHGRTATPADAIAAGATQLVIGRPITGADDPAAAFDRIVASLDPS